MNKKFILLLLLSAVLTTAKASDLDTVSYAEHHSLWKMVLTENLQNPAFMQDAYRTSLSEFSIYMDYDHQDKALIHQDGSGYLLGGITAGTYLKMNDRTTVWGSASYRTGTKRHIWYNSTSDYDLLYPYVMGDTLGGNLKNEQYTFSGGCATSFGNFTIGETLDFRAEHEYRAEDPRPRGIVTDVNMAVGLGYRFLNYDIGAGVGGIFYKQTTSVEFLKESGVIPEYHFTGLGTDYARFAGANTSTYYKGTGIRTNISLRPVEGSGASLYAAYDYTPYKKILSDINSFPLSTLYLENYQVEGGWKQQGNGFNWAALGGLNYQKRIGDEHISGNSSSSEYDVIATMTMYHSHVADYYAGAAVNWGNRNNWSLSGKTGYMDGAFEYVLPLRKMSYSKWFSQLDAQLISALSSHVILNLRLGASLYHNLDNNITMPYVNMDKNITKLINDTYENLTANYFKINPSVRIDVHPASWKKMGFFASADGFVTNTSHNDEYRMKLSMGVTF